MGHDDCEALAQQASEDSGLSDRPDADPAVMAVGYCGLRLVPCHGSRARLVEDRLYYPAHVDPQHRAYLQAHEVGHDIIRYAGWRLDRPTEELCASRIGCAILLPRRAFVRDMRDIGADLPALAALWTLATPWVIARRMAEVRHGSVAARRRGRATETAGAGDAARLDDALEEAARVGIARGPGVCAVRVAPRDVVGVLLSV